MYFSLLPAAVRVGQVVTGSVANRLSDVVFVFMIAAVLPLAALLLLVLPAYLVWALFRGPAVGLSGHVGEIACLTCIFSPGLISPSS